MLHHSTHIIFCMLSWYFWKSCMDKNLLSFFNHMLPKLKNQTGITWLQGQTWLAKMPCATKLSYSVGQLTSILSRDAYTHLTGATNLHQWLLSGGPNAGIRRGSRTDVDLVMQNFIKKLYEYLHKTVTSQGRMFLGSNLERVTSKQNYVIKTTCTNKPHLAAYLILHYQT